MTVKARHCCVGYRRAACARYDEISGQLYGEIVDNAPFAVADDFMLDQETHPRAGAIDAALINSPAGARQWGVCTECGMGRVDATDVPRLLDLHSQILTA